MRWKYENPIRVVESCRKMIRKLYPDFDEKKHYVLWIISDFFDNHDIAGIEGSVKIFDEHNNQIFENLTVGNKDAKVLVRTPYYNKYIRQVGLKTGSKCLFGIPLVFDNYEDLIKVRKVHVHWNVAFNVVMYRNPSVPFGIRLACVDSFYNIDYDLTGIQENHWFTINHQDNCWDYHKEYSKAADEYYDAAMLVTHLQVNVDDDKYVMTECDLATCAAHRRFTELSDLEEQGVEFVLNHDVNDVGKFASKLDAKSDVWDLDWYYHIKNITLIPDPYADLLSEPGFGFV